MGEVRRDGFYIPLAVYMTDDGGEWTVRDYAGQSGRFVIYGTWTADILASFRTLEGAKEFIVERAGTGKWEW